MQCTGDAGKAWLSEIAGMIFQTRSKKVFRRVLQMLG